MVGGNLWQVRSGRLNVYHAILLLSYSMMLRKIEGADQIAHLVGGKKKSTKLIGFT